MDRVSESGWYEQDSLTVTEQLTYLLLVDQSEWNRSKLVDFLETVRKTLLTEQHGIPETLDQVHDRASWVNLSCQEPAGRDIEMSDTL